MPSYEATIIADGPLFYARLDDLSGTVMLDVSGNENHGTYFSDCIFGIASPIETDPASRAIRNRVGVVPASVNPVAAFTWEAWGLFDPDLFITGSLIVRGGQVGLSASNYLVLDGAQARAQITTGAGSFNLIYGLGTNYGWYHLVCTRNGNVGRLYVNGRLEDEETELGVTDITGWGFPVGQFHIGTSEHSPAAWQSWGTDEPAIYDYALTAGQVLAHYEAALATLPVSATINIRVVVELDTDQTVPVDFPFAHNFAEAISGNPRPIVEHLAYKTNVNQSEPDYQQRINAQPYHAERTLGYAVTPTSSRARAMMQAALWTPGTIYKLPIGNDWGTLTSPAAASATSLSLDTTIRDYEIGSYVCVWQDIYEPWGAQFFQITSRNDTTLGITPAVTTTFPSGSPVMPARLARLPEDNLAVNSHLIDRETAALQFEVLSTELSSRRITAYTPGTTYLSLEVFSLERAKVEWLDPSPYQITRRFQGTGTPTGNDYQRAIDTGSRQTVPLRVLLTSRAAISEFYGWLDARQGKINPVWVVSQENDFTAVGQAAGSITVSYIGYAALYAVHSARRDIAIKKTDGSTIYRRITAAVDNGDGTETLSIPSAPALADISKVSFLKFCTAPDQFEIRYHRDGSGFIAECEFVMTELLTTPT